MTQTIRSGLALATALLFSLVATVTHALAREAEIYTGVFSSTALSGYDPVAYFTMGRPVKGSSQFQTEWKGAIWHFANAEHLAKFQASPQAFAPQYGGYCAWAVSQGYTASADPQAWNIVNGKLYVNYDKSVQTTWSKDIPGNIGKADRNWPGVLN